ncbi:hypothetical protein PMIN06_000996 [Paraphaeosphaeria minitans]
MSHNHAQIPQKRERHTAIDAEQPGASAQKAAKLGENTDAATAIHSQHTKQTLDMPKGRARPDSATPYLTPSMESLLNWQKSYDANRPGRSPSPWEDPSECKTTTSERTATSKAGANSKGTTKATDDGQRDHQNGVHHDAQHYDQHGDQNGERHDGHHDGQHNGQHNSQHNEQHDNRTENATQTEPQQDVRSIWSTSSEGSSGVQERIGDLFDAPDDVVLVHACNTQGSWGAGIAKEFRKRYPMAFSLYQEHCLANHHPKSDPVPTGSCLLIPPSEEYSGARRHWIACLFTSEKYGGKKDSQARILASTPLAFRHLLALLKRQAREIGPAIQEIRMCQINSGLFAVKWQSTKNILQAVLESDVDHPPVRVYSLATAPSNPNTVQKQLQKGQATLEAFIRRH